MPPEQYAPPPVTLNAIASQSYAPRANPALSAALAITAIAAATLAGAWFFQLVLDIRPCPLCLEQRYAYYLAIPLGALVAFAAARDTPRSVLIDYGFSAEEISNLIESACVKVG